MNKKYLIFGGILTLIALTFALYALYYLKTNYYFEKKIVTKIKNSPRVEKTEKDFDYTIVLAGDSLTEYLGNLEELGYFLNQKYPDKDFLLLNYGYSSTNILSLPDRAEKDSTHSGRIFQPINNIPFDLILIESFGHNPLSELPLEEGLKKQNETLDKVIETLSQKHPKSAIVFVATISPNSKNYAKGSIDLDQKTRQKWVDERIAYIKNHIKYAGDHNIPLINIYEKSLNIFGDGDNSLIRKEDNIHPSVKGIYFIDEQIADFIYKNRLIGNLK